MRATAIFLAIFLAAARVAVATEWVGEQRPALETGGDASHAFLVFDDIASIENVRVFPPDPTIHETIMISANIVRPELSASLPIDKAVLKWRPNGETEWRELPMTKSILDETYYFARIEPQAKSFEFIIGAEDIGGSRVQELPQYKGGFPLDLGPETAIALDPNDSDRETIRDLDVLATAAAYDESSFYVDMRVDGKIARGSVSPTDLHLYACFLINRDRQKGLAHILDIPAFLYAPLFSTAISFKNGIYTFADMGDFKNLANSRRDNPGFDYKAGKQRISIKAPFEMLGDNPNGKLQTGCFAASLTDLKRPNLLPRDMGSYVTIYKRSHRVAVRLEAKPEPLWAGAAEIDITPSAGTPMGGYSARGGRPSEGVLDPVLAQALAIKAGKREHIFVSVDAVMYTHEMYEKTVEIVELETGVPRHQISIGASHTHTGTGAVPKFAAIVSGPYRPEVEEELIGRVAKVAEQAWFSLQPATFAYGTSQIDLTNNRVFEGGTEDDELLVARFDNLASDPIAVFFNYATHPVTRGEIMKFSADFPGEVRDRIKARWPRAVGLFFNGAEGDQNPSELNGISIGEAMGKRVVEMAEEMPEGKRNVRLSSLWIKLLFSKKIGYESMMQGVRIDDFGLFTLPGELFSEVAQRIKARGRELGFKQIAALGLTTDTVGYITPEEIYHRRPYEALFTLFGDREAFFVETIARDLMLRLSERRQ